MATAADVLALARSQIGVSENPPGSNRGTPYHAWFGAHSQGWQWCAIFVAWVYHHTDPALIHGLRSAYSGDYLTVGRRHGEEIAPPRPGAIAIMDYGDGGITDHIGIVESVSGSSMTLIEGNHNNRVERVTRVIGGSTRFWYVMPKYSQPEEEEMIASVDSGPVPVMGWTTAGLLKDPGAFWLDVVNKGSADAQVTVTIQRLGPVGTGDFGSKVITVQAPKAGPPPVVGGVSFDLNETFKNAGNVSVVIDSTQPVYVKATQKL